MRRNEYHEAAMRHELERIDKPLVVSGVDAVEGGTVAVVNYLAIVNVCLLGAVVIAAQSCLVDVSERSFGEAHEQAAGDEN